MGMRNSESTLYQKMLAQVAKQYADMRLADMTGDTDASRLFTTDNVVPGMFTRQAWEEAVAPAIEKIVTARREEIDWVLSDSKKPATQQLSPDALKQRLAARYFADFSGAWLDFLNSLRWQPAATLSDAIDQLTLMADVRQSPLVALMNTLSIQGRTGQASEALSDSLVKSAKNLFGQDKQPAIDQGSGAHDPLDATFGPVLALIDEKAQGMGSREAQFADLSHPRDAGETASAAGHQCHRSAGDDPGAGADGVSGQGYRFNRNPRLRQSGCCWAWAGVGRLRTNRFCAAHGAGLAAGSGPGSAKP
ncbi:probable membrane protein YPO1482 [Cronobacter sakazakii 680]|nr:probable membrane protein YPO1482 [Cronobacter sakazakii 680]